jgi:hypothetical protein
MVLPVDEYWRRTALQNPPDFTENDSMSMRGSPSTATMSAK